MKWYLALTGWLFTHAFVTHPALAYTFTNSKGQSFDGEIQAVSTDGARVTILRTTDKQKFDLPVNTFTPEVQDHIRQWSKENIAYSVTVAKSSKTIDRVQTRGNQSTITTKKMAYDVSVTNRSFVALEELRMEYRLFNNRQGTRDARLAYVKGVHKLGTLAHNGELKFTTEPIDVSETKMDAGWRYSDANGRVSVMNMSDEFGGIWMRLYHKDKLVTEVKDLNSDFKEVSWDPSEVTTTSARSR